MLTMEATLWRGRLMYTEFAYTSKKPNNRIVRYLRHVPVLHVAAIAPFRLPAPSARTGDRGPQRLRYVLDELVHCGRGSGCVPQRCSSSRIGMGVRGSSVRLHRGLRDIAARRTGTRGAVSIQAECTYRIYRFQRGGSKKISRRTREAIQRWQIPFNEQ